MCFCFVRPCRAESRRCAADPRATPQQDTCEFTSLVFEEVDNVCVGMVHSLGFTEVGVFVWISCWLDPRFAPALRLDFCSVLSAVRRHLVAHIPILAYVRQSRPSAVEAAHWLYCVLLGQTALSG